MRLAVLLLLLISAGLLIARNGDKSNGSERQQLPKKNGSIDINNIDFTFVSNGLIGINGQSQTHKMVLIRQGLR